MHSLRTALALADLTLVGDLATYLGTALDPFVENIFQNLLKCSGVTKKLIVQAASVSALALLASTSYHPKLLNHLWFALQDKNQQSRYCAMTFARALVEHHGPREHSAQVIERTGGLDTLEKILKKGLSDAAPNVRECCRVVFWLVWECWREKGER